MPLATIIFSFEKPSISAKRKAGMYALINNSAWTAKIYYAYIDTSSDCDACIVEFPTGLEASDPNHERTLHIEGFDTTSIPQTQIIIDIPYFKNFGIYKIDSSDSKSATASYVCPLGDLATSGVIAVSQLSDSNVQGTFNFITERGVRIRSGYFNIKLVNK